MRLKNNRNFETIDQDLIVYFKLLKYHNWMKSEELQKLTASQPLSLEQEYAMQRSWREDEDKCTFIILDKNHFDTNNDEIEAMIGDTNIFITDKDNSVGEIEIMIAEQSARQKKLGWESVILMLLYGVKFINIKCFEAKISFHNDVSIKMFSKLGFVEKSRSEVFEEITLEKIMSEDWEEWLQNEIKWEIKDY
ncbi:N-acetyltransferase 9 isoform X3 [Melitaea cinxia]|uniref:N-acetyltransferase 9 isoform X3 n=1 Tax=Melitaea cinxia TaxID=113334 RepID=UPI001E27494F|nr:N-acetyltransferase 9 isoform X3 [Melitaea cinxia]